MAVELSYVFITPYTLKKSRTGGVISRLLSRTDLDLVGAQVMTFDHEITEKYAEAIEKTIGPRNRETSKLLKKYVLQNFAPTDGIGHRTMMLLFKGEDACSKLATIAGTFNSDRMQSEKITGETVRDTYADLVMSRSHPGVVRYFEPAILTPPTQDLALEKLDIFAEYAKKSKNLVDNYEYLAEPQRTLVIIKPDNWRRPSTRPGNIIDVLSRTGLRIVGAKTFQMTVSEGLEFYGPVRKALRKKLSGKTAERASSLLEKEFGITLESEISDCLKNSVGRAFADDQFNRILEFMTGRRADSCTESEKDLPGLVKSMVLVYEGADAVNKIRNVLGPTDPERAPGGTVRSDFGSSIMVNSAHASDSVENVEREMKIIKINQNNLFREIEKFVKHY